MDESRHDPSSEAPHIVTDQATSAGSDKPAVADDDRPDKAPQPFDVEDAVTQTAVHDAETEGDDDA